MDGGLAKKLNDTKTEAGIQSLESTIPTPKSTSTQALTKHAEHVRAHWKRPQPYQRITASGLDQCALQKSQAKRIERGLDRSAGGRVSHRSCQAVIDTRGETTRY